MPQRSSCRSAPDGDRVQRLLQSERRCRSQTTLTLPQVRAVVPEVLTAHFFMTRPQYLKWMPELTNVELRI
jgi:hypothetical protein